MGYKEKYEKWLNDPIFDEAAKAELKALADENEIEDRFHTELEFGTAGLRGIMGAGDNRMNVYTVGKAACGIAKYLVSEVGEGLKCAVAYDCRNNSRLFGGIVSANLLKAGIKVYMFPTLAPTPLLAHAIRSLGCEAGFMITASHNTKIYNGLKVFDGEGKQPLTNVTDKMTEYINATTYAEAVTSEEGWTDKIDFIDDSMGEDFIQSVLNCGILEDKQAKSALRVVYTPLHGTGGAYVPQVLKRAGFTQTFTETRQMEVDGNFPTVVSPNPEEKAAMMKIRDMANHMMADIAIATDPDSDRIGIAVRHNGKMVLVNGNQTGVLLAEHLFTRKPNLPKVPVLIKTIVTGDMAGLLVEKRGGKVYESLTGFKNIIGAADKIDPEKGEGFVMGYEESYGYVVAPHIKDKDGVSAALLICEAAAYWKKRGKTLIDVLVDIYGEVGRHLDLVDYTVFEGIDGAEKMNAFLAELRQDPHKYFEGIVEVKDYLKGLDGVDPSDVLKFRFADGSFIATRRSGTEPKIKFYYSIVCDTAKEGEDRIDRYREIIKNIINK